MADNLFEAKVDLELPVQVFADAFGTISRGLKRIYTKENGDVVFVLTDGTEHIVGNVVGQQGPTGPASTIPGPTGHREYITAARSRAAPISRCGLTRAVQRAFLFPLPGQPELPEAPA